MSWESQGIDLLVAALVRPFVLVAAAWLILRVLRVRHPASRHAVWTAVLIGTLMLPVVSVTAPHFKLPLLPGPRAAVPTVLLPPAVEAFKRLDSVAPSASTVIRGKPAFEWPTAETAILWCYCVGLFATLAYRATGWALLWRVVRRSRPLRARRLRESGDILVPVAVGVLRPAVILPAGWRDWSPNTRRAVLAHEFAHLRRHDALVSALMRLVKCVFWFHPLAWWLSRTISNLAELACDAAALERVGDPAGYSRILLQFASAVNGAGYRVALPGLAMAARFGIGERIDQVFELSGGKMRKLVRPRFVLAFMGVPLMCLAATAGLGSKSASVVAAQVKAAASKFEVASVRPCKDAGGRSDTKMGPAGGSPTISPGRLNTGCALLAASYPMAGLIQRVYGRLGLGHVPALGSALPISGGPGWISSDYYLINAQTAEKASEATMEGPMLQALLEDRFKLKVHRETRELPVYALTVGKGGFKLPRVVEGSCVVPDPSIWPPPPAPPGKTRCFNTGVGGRKGPNTVLNQDETTLDGFAKLLGLVLDRPVIDRTGLAGKYNFHLTFAIDETTPRVVEFGPPSDDPPAPSIFTVVQEQLGLKLEATKGPRDFLVIDHVERPSEN
jgi:bla regulator protein BlaR1